MIRKNILIILNNGDNTKEFVDWIKAIFKNENLELFIYDEKKVDAKLATSDFVINFLNGNNFIDVQKKIELMNLNYFGEKLVNQKIFSEKINFKNILKISGFKTAIFEKINNRNYLDLFNNFLQPSRIFSKNNEFFSDKITDIEKLKEVLKSFEKLDDFYIEEYIEGDDIYVLFNVNSGEFFEVFSVKQKDNICSKLEIKLDKLVREEVVDFIKKNELKGPGLLNLKFNKKRGLYFLNIFLKNIEIFNRRELIEEILETHSSIDFKKLIQKNLF